MKYLKISLYIFFLCLSTQLFAQTKNELSELPLHLNPGTEDKPLVVYMSGDGGWNSFSQSLSAELQKNGYAVVSLDTRKYFWQQKTPDQFARDTQRILDHYMKTWNKSSWILLGYSFGADAGSFVPSRLTKTSGNQLESVVLLSPGFSTGFVTKISNMLGFGGTDKDQYKVYPELLKSPAPVLCIFGKDEDSDLYPALKTTGNIKKMLIPGNHKFNDDVKLITKLVIQSR
ncbi:AcvB/VirJ family lysyl-phosphatidylglycerol hydrolase [Pedobacter duraquae]|uniref:Virulence protein VirJ n=1 Tax=Pedobacter duraquae TaxID=425511 RepID=A0A4R6IQW9_9SPHI|nr:AcvB/VirJ family lysyl-phosphatidylglycerol hydrolase [Pedobacter duraquae]TDO24780.1 virulence protein VirJ [Pedobacter duraquae]